jgi:hypothetical protein
VGRRIARREGLLAVDIGILLDLIGPIDCPIRFLCHRPPPIVLGFDDPLLRLNPLVGWT